MKPSLENIPACKTVTVKIEKTGTAYPEIRAIHTGKIPA